MSAALLAATATHAPARRNRRALLALFLFALACMAAYLLLSLDIRQPRLASYALSLRLPKLGAMLLTAIAIGCAAIAFQTIVHNTIVTPCLLGMNALYTLIHTVVFFFCGAGSFLAASANAAFAVDLALMGTAATALYSFLFARTNYNVLYVLLIGTVMTSFFSSIQATLVRVMDPNEYDALLARLVASFSHVNGDILAASCLLLFALGFLLRRELALLDVIALGRAQAMSLGVDYDPAVRRLLLGVTLAIAVATAMVGPLSFMGLIVANLSRELLATFRHRQLMAGAALFGMAVLIGGQALVERAFSYAIPISVFITTGGGIYFLYLLLRKA